VDRTGCQWRQLPKDFPPHTTVYNYFWEWTRYGVLDRIHQMLTEGCREDCGRQSDPNAGIVDTQVAKAPEKGGSTLIRAITGGASMPSSTPKATSSRSRISRIATLPLV